MICQECGKETVEGKFCQFCGAKLVSDEKPAATEQEIEPSEAEVDPVEPTEPVDTTIQPMETAEPVDSADPLETVENSPEAETNDKAEQEEVTIEEIPAEETSIEEVSKEVVAEEEASNVEQIAATEEQVVEQEPNKFVEMLKDESSKLGTFLLTHIKKPRDAKDTTGNYFISGIIIMVFLSLIITVNYNMDIPSIMKSGFVDDFLVPLLKHIAMFGLLPVIAFGAAKAVLQDISIKDAFAKYGAYLVPFTLLYIIGVILSLVKLFALSAILVYFSFIGIVFLIPVLILTEQDVKGFDLVYAIIAVTLVSLIVFGYLSSTIFGEMLKFL